MDVSGKLSKFEEDCRDFLTRITKDIMKSSDISKILKEITEQIKIFIELRLSELIQEQTGKEAVQILISVIFKSLEEQLLSKTNNEEDKKNIKKQLYVSSQYLFMNSSDKTLYSKVKDFVNKNMVEISFREFDFSPQNLWKEFFDAEQPFIDDNTVEYLISSFLRFKKYDTESNKSGDKKSPYVKMRKHITALSNKYLAQNPILLFTFFHLFLDYINQESKEQGSQEDVSDIYDLFLYLLVDILFDRLYIISGSKFLSPDDLKIKRTVPLQRPKMQEWYNISLILRALAKHHRKILLFVFGKVFCNAFFLFPFPFGLVFKKDEMKEEEKSVLEFITELFLFKATGVIFYDDIAIDDQNWLAIIYRANDQKREDYFKLFCYFYWSFLLAKQEHLDFFDVKFSRKNVEGLLEQLGKEYSKAPSEFPRISNEEEEAIESITEFFQKGSFSDLFFLWLSKFVLFHNYHKEKSYTVFISTLVAYHINKPKKKSEKDKIQREIMEKYLEYAKFLMQENRDNKIIEEHKHMVFKLFAEIIEQQESPPDFFERKEVLEKDLEELLKVLTREELSRTEEVSEPRATTARKPPSYRKGYTESAPKFSKPPPASRSKGGRGFSWSRK
jgi:hypothetical protein